MPSTRYHYLDATRGVLMILGITYHAARVYGVTDWIVAPIESLALASAFHQLTCLANESPTADPLA